MKAYFLKESILKQKSLMAQKSITAYFKSSNTNKRPNDSVAGDDDDDTKKIKKTKPNEEKVFKDFDVAEIKARIRRQSIVTPALSDNIGPSWFKALEKEFSKDYFKKLSQFLKSERMQHTVYPPEDKVYSWTMMCDIREVKVVILGQDPYHGPNQAHGLCFSVMKGVPPPPSLLNMYQELSRDIPDFKTPKHGDLTGWAKQGVLLLNACLTVRARNANSHANMGWEKLTDAVIKWLDTNLHGLVFLLWGSYAQKKGSCINPKNHLVLKTVHPSPLSAHRGFIGCGHFSKANDYLKKNGKGTIDWSHLP